MINTKKLLLWAAFAAWCWVSATAQAPEYTLVWADEFDVDGAPGPDWNFERGFVRNHELQWYQPDNAWVAGGCLVIEGRKEQKPCPSYRRGSDDWRHSRPQIEYTSSCLNTKGHFEFQKGRVEVRAKIPVARGSWPAIWLLGNRNHWPHCGEIDMMEYYLANGHPAILANVAWGSGEQFKPVWDTSITPLTHFTDRDPEWADKFHIWRMDWDDDYIRLYLDDELLNETPLAKTVNGPAYGDTDNPFDSRHPGFADYLLLNLALGANGGEPDPEAFPMQYLVDYARVYQKK